MPDIPDIDPGNAGGSLVIPPSPIKPARNQHACEICGHRFETENDLEQHAKGHVVPHPVLVSGDTAVPSSCVLTDAGAVRALRARDASRLEINKRPCRPDTLQDVLLRMNGRSDVEVTLVGQQEHVRNVYRLHVAIFDGKRLSQIESAFLAKLNGAYPAIPDIPDFLRAWAGTPERAYADALAAFRLAIIMRNDDPFVSDLDDGSGYRHRLAEVRQGLQPTSRRLARTILAVCGLIENDFSPARVHLRDRPIENAMAWFQHLVDGRQLRWAAERGASVRLVVDANTQMLIEAVDCLRQGDAAHADGLLTKLANACTDGRDVACAKKVAALLWWRDSSAGAPAILQGDPVFAGMLQRKR